MCSAAGSPVPEGPGPVGELLLPPTDGQERGLGGTDTELSVVPPKISFEKDDDFTRVLDLDLPDGDADLGGAGEGDCSVLPAMNVSRNPDIDTDTALAAVRDGPPLVRRFGDGGQGGPEQRERCVGGERTDQAAVCQLDSDIFVDSLGVFVSGRVIERSVSRTRVVQETEVPAEGKAEDQLVAVKVADEESVPRSWVDGTVTEGNTCSVDIAQAGRMRPNFLNDVDEIGNEHGARSDRQLVTLTRGGRDRGDDISENIGADGGDNFFDNVNRECGPKARIC